MARGFNVYDITTGTALGSFKFQHGSAHRAPVSFLHGGRSLVGGSSIGRTWVWDVDAEDVRQVIPHEDDGVVLAIDAPPLDEQGRTVLAIATASGEEAGLTIKLWDNRDHQEHQEGRDLDQKPAVDPGIPYRPISWRVFIDQSTWMCCVFAPLLAFAVVGPWLLCEFLFSM
ncbi:hypothetical protein CONPUDRAFT_156758 [Coniophora puteana RWD-64-598 SS2]|uniref:WD40 repeat-like protein n=1 Tax=Coniophora puteana (strain RWD-64-598) TaxID=741705 RepID=A0A5M3MER4_CONPW|nr:uncharacterized protein CONPUDRAFT_156758 [Coniophora puteana RWD-64-598 SS2]EIW77537.1 hypothetical protein CONPUDRAFT_156758 [Coniophora puteana RWD-64-598 SS2]